VEGVYLMMIAAKNRTDKKMRMNLFKPGNNLSYKILLPIFLNKIPENTS
jgi:hypothetical protein